METSRYKTCKADFFKNVYYLSNREAGIPMKVSCNFPTCKDNFRFWLIASSSEGSGDQISMKFLLV